MKKIKVFYLVVDVSKTSPDIYRNAICGEVERETLNCYIVNDCLIPIDCVNNEVCVIDTELSTSYRIGFSFVKDGSFTEIKKERYTNKLFSYVMKELEKYKNNLDKIIKNIECEINKNI